MRRLLSVMVIASACEGADPGAKAERAWVMVEPLAAEAGFLVKHDDWVDAPALPTEVDPELPTWLHDPDGAEVALDLPAGMIGKVDATGEVVLYELGVDVPGDRLWVRATPPGVEALADLIDARVERAGGDFVLVADDLLERSSFLSLPEGVRAVSLTATMLEASSVPSRAGYAIANGQEDQLASLVGVYRSTGGLLVVDADGGFSYSDCKTCSCDLILRGRVLMGDDGVTLLEDQGRAIRLTLNEGQLQGDGETFTAIGDP